MIAFPMLGTMFLAGIWHGAGMQFILFGVVHGIYLVINHGFRTVVAEDSRWHRFLPAPVGVLLTFGAVLVGQVFFRANSASDAFYVLGSLIGLHGHGLALSAQLQRSPAATVGWIALSFFIVWALPNTQEILNQLEKGARRSLSLLPRLYWEPNLAWAAALCVIIFSSLVMIAEGTTFLYFQF